MPIYLEVAVNVPQVTGVFHYHLPEALQGRVEPGHLVVVPFGKQIVQGVVLQAVPEPDVADTRPIMGLVDPSAVLTPGQIQLARYLSEQYLASLADCIGLMLPPGLGKRADTLFELDPAAQAAGQQDGAALTDTQTRLMTALKRRGPLRGNQLSQAFTHANWRLAARALQRRGLIRSQSILPPPSVSPKLVRTVQLACPPEVVKAALPTLGRSGTQALARRQAILCFLMLEPGPVEVSWVYAESGGSLEDLRYLSDLGMVVLGESEVWRDPLRTLDVPVTQPPPLTSDQKPVWAEIEKRLREAASGRQVHPILLHGVTGSGKTEIYLRAVEATLLMKKQAIVLVPEIALTPQTVRRFVSRFPGQVGLVHSNLSDGERYDTWRRARSGSLPVIIGPRSALFAPLSNLGLVVVDESHDDSYHQSDLQPRYHARDAAIAYARQAGAVCLLGTATPDVVNTYRAAQGKMIYLHLPTRILAHQQVVRAHAERLGLESRFHLLEGLAETIDMPPVTVVDMRQEFRDGNRSIFSSELRAALEQVLERGEQAILFLNRRGGATYIFCRSCGNSLKCPRCDLPLTSQGPESTLVCHHCGYKRGMPARCPRCNSHQIRQFGAGTERVEAEVQALFPQARTLRWDATTTRQKGAHEMILNHFVAHRADILVGTQMLAKSLDLPFVTLVGAVLADVGLSLPDYRAAERTFQVLTQVAGRAGRSLLGGRVIFQTYLPEHYAIQAASRHDYKAFYQRELEYRRRLGYPPFNRLVRLECRATDASAAEQEAQRMADRVQAWLAAEGLRATQVVGPAPCFFSRLGGQYRWQIILRGPDPLAALRGRPMAEWRVEVDPTDLL